MNDFSAMMLNTLLFVL